MSVSVTTDGGRRRRPVLLSLAPMKWNQVRPAEGDLRRLPRAAAAKVEIRRSSCALCRWTGLTRTRNTKNQHAGRLLRLPLLAPFVGKLGYRALVAPDFGFPRATPLASSPLRPTEAPTRSVRGLVHVLRSHAALTLWSVDAARRKILRGAAGSSALRSRASGGAHCAAAARAASFEAGGRCRATS